MTTTIRAMLFDMDDVLCAYDWRGRVAALARLAGRPVDAVAAAIWQSGFEDEADRGAYDAEAYLAGFSERLGLPLRRADWIANRRAAMTPWPDMLALAVSLKMAGLRIGVLTNNGTLTADCIDELYPQLRPLFGPAIFVSATLRLAKPDPAIYRAACDRLGVAPAQAAFTDDLAVNVAGAREAGLTAWLFTGPAALRQALRQAGVPGLAAPDQG